MKISEFLAELKKRNTLLYLFGNLNLFVFLVCLVFYFVDQTHIMGINAWIKPMKFALSIALYTFTFGWLLHYLQDSRKRRIITWVVLICMTAEMAIIFYQALRGQQSHYNISTGFNALLFSIMGAFIGINSLINFYTLVLFYLKKEVRLVGPEVSAWRMGLFLFVVGGISGGWMISQMAHTVGAPDGGPGLPFVNWSTVAGDIRVAHFITLHGLQAIPIFWFVVAARSSHPQRMVTWFSVAYVVACLLLHLLSYQAFRLFHNKTQITNTNFHKSHCLSCPL